jgi:hypothetical protein
MGQTQRSIVIAGMAGIGAERKLDSEIAGFRFCPKCAIRDRTVEPPGRVETRRGSGNATEHRFRSTWTLTPRTTRSMSGTLKCRVRRPPRMSNSVSATARPAISGSLPALGLSALGVVFGDIGTSPLYTLKTVLGLTASPTLNRHGRGTLHGQPRFYYHRKCPVRRADAEKLALEGGELGIVRKRRA